MTFIDNRKGHTTEAQRTQRGHRASRPGVYPQMTRRAIATQRKGAKTQSSEKTQRCGDAETQRGAEATRTSGENSTAHGGRVSLVRTAVPNAGVRPSSSTQRPALAQSAGLTSHADQNLAFEQARLRRNRRTGGASAGGKSDRDERWRSKRSGFSTAPGDREIAGISASSLRAPSQMQEAPLCAFASLRLCVVFRVRIWVNLGDLWAESGKHH